MQKPAEILDREREWEELVRIWRRRGPELLFARDVYLLDQSEAKTTRDGLRVSFPAATGTKAAGTVATVTREGELKVYYGIAFRA